MHKKITKIINILPSVENRNDPKLLNVGLILHQLKADASISNKARELAKDAIECIDIIMSECSEFNREVKRLALITEEMSYSYEKGTWINSIQQTGKEFEFINKQCDICNVSPFFAMEFLRELDKNVDQIRMTLFKIKLNMEDKGLSRLCYKSFHTLNGIAGYLDLRKLQRLLLLAEKYVLEDIKEDRPIGEECIEFLFEVFRSIKEYFKNWKKRGDSVIIIPESFFEIFEKYPKPSFGIEFLNNNKKNQVN